MRLEGDRERKSNARRARRKSPGAARAREYRARRKCGLYVVPIEIDEDTIKRAVRLGLLPLGERRFTAGMSAVLSEWIENRLEQEFASRVTGADSATVPCSPIPEEE